MAGILNSLSQTVIKAGSPGVPDFYQGTELWDYNLVDPDNRRPVDFATRRTMLEEIIREADRNRLELVEKLLGSPAGRAHQDVCDPSRPAISPQPSRVVRERSLRAARGRRRARASRDRFRATRRARKRDSRRRPLFHHALGIAADSFPAGAVWSDTRVILPPDLAPRRYVDLFTGCGIDVRAEEGTPQLLSMDEAFARMPISMLVPSD